jgi:hypothetical protein
MKLGDFVEYKQPKSANPEQNRRLDRVLTPDNATRFNRQMSDRLERISMLPTLDVYQKTFIDQLADLSLRNTVSCIDFAGVKPLEDTALAEEVVRCGVAITGRPVKVHLPKLVLPGPLTGALDSFTGSSEVSVRRQPEKRHEVEHFARCAAELFTKTVVNHGDVPMSRYLTDNLSLLTERYNETTLTLEAEQ